MPVDLSAEMSELWASLGAPTGGRGRVIQFVAARRGEGTSTVARELAAFAARKAGRSVWLVDLDLFTSAQHAALANATGRFGKLGEATAATPDGSVFFTVQPPVAAPDGTVWPDARYLCGHRVGEARWWVTRFRREALRGRQTVHIVPSADYWNALRKFADIVIVDAPSIDKSQAALTIAPYMDQTVLVVAADEADAKPPALLRDAIMGAGGTVSGLFFNRGTVETPGFLRAVLP
jgi:hypothetical protein